MKGLRYGIAILFASSLGLPGGFGCGDKVKSKSETSCTEDGRISLDIAPGECMALRLDCAAAREHSAVYTSTEYTLTPDWSENDWLTLEEDENEIYRLCAHEEAELGKSAQVGIVVETRGMSTEPLERLLVDVNVLGWTFTVETPDLNGFEIEEGTRFTVQSIVLGRSGGISYDFRSERVSTKPCLFPRVEPATTDSPIEFFSGKPDRYWAEAYAPAGIKPGCYNIIGMVTPHGETAPLEEFKQLSVREPVEAIIDIDSSEFFVGNWDVSISGNQSTPSNGLLTWSVLHTPVGSTTYSEVAHYLESYGSRFVIEEIQAGTYTIELTVRDPNMEDNNTHTEYHQVVVPE